MYVRTHIGYVSAVFYSSTETIFTHNRKNSQVRNTSQRAPDAMQYVLSNICTFCSGPYSEFVQLFGCICGFHKRQKRQVKLCIIMRKKGPSTSYPSAWEIHALTVTESMSKMNKYIVHWKNKIVGTLVELRKNIIFEYV
jgi:hypothetical protein